MRLEPKPDNPCFGCGGANTRGMKLAFEQDDAGQRIHGRFRLGIDYCGGPDFIHGGIIATVLDEAMGKVSRFRQVHAVTAELVIEYLKFVGVDEELVVEAHEVEKNGRVLHRTGEIRNSKGELLARGRGRFVEIDPARIGRRSATDSASGEQIVKS
jgi:acyl-coenzyme A thioesterase PaaI-like protein